MTSELPALKPRRVITALQKAGFEVKRQTGSHVIMHKSSINHPISIPQHTKDLPKGTPRTIIRQSGLTIEEFISLLK